MANKVDFKKELRQLYNPSTRGIHVVEVPPMHFLILDGVGNPNTSLEYQQTVDALFSLSYGIKFALKPHGYDHIVPPLEGLWWTDNMDEFNMEDKDRWNWTMMIMQPEWVTTEWIDKVRQESVKKKANDKLAKIRFERYYEGLAAQILYTGAYSDEAPTISEMHEFICSNGCQLNGIHHEIYLSDPRKTSPDRLKTILRQPIHKI